MASGLDLSRLLDCVAISDALDGLLIHGATSGATLEFLADELDARLRAAGAAAVDRVWLGSADTEDALWGVPDLPFGWVRPGLLDPPDGTTRIVIVPDLSRLSLAASRAGVMVLGNQFVQIERRGGSRVVPIRHRWIAAVDDEHRDGVSRHLIERFAIRVRFAAPATGDRQAWLTRQFEATSSSSSSRRRATSSAVSAVSRALRSVGVTRTALSEVIALTDRSAGEGIAGGNTAGESMRPAISLLRVAEALARLSRTPKVTRKTVRDAAYALGLIASDVERDGDGDDDAGDIGDTRDSQQSAVDTRGAGAVQEPRVVTPVLDEAPQEIADARPSGPGDVVATPESELEGLPVPLAPEPSERDTRPGPYGALRLPWQQTQAAASGRGTIIGTRRTDTLRDLAIVETLIAAAPFQAERRKALRLRSGGMILRRSDLRSYRREPAAGDLLVLVLDYTSVAGRAWLPAIGPFLANAYRVRAELCVIKVGAASASNQFRADRLMARSVLVPSVAAALDEAAGRATPLADGLSLAFRTIRQTLGHGRATTRRATLIVVTDGRGNVSLDASREGRWLTRVGRQGIDDAKRIARELRELPHVRRVLIDPQPAYLRDLPLGLAAALGAHVVPIDRTLERERRDG